MGKSKKQVSALNLEGRFLGFIIHKGEKKKRFGLATAQGEHCIKLALSKKKRAALESFLSPGDWVRVYGEKKLDKKTGKIQLKAHQIVPVSVATGATVTQTVTRQPAACSIPAGITTLQAPPCAAASTCIHALTEAETPALESQKKASILVCQKSDCRKRGGKEICEALEEHLREKGLEEHVTIKSTGCMKRCKAGPNVIVMPDKTRYSKIEPEEIPQLIAKHF